MKDVLLIAAVLVIFISGYFVMTRIDKILNENCKALYTTKDKKIPSCVILTDALSDEDILEEIRHFRTSHNNIRIVVYDSSDAGLSEAIEYHSCAKKGGLF